MTFLNDSADTVHGFHRAKAFMRQAVKAIFIREMEERGLTPVVASHNLRELEDVCESVKY